MKLKRLIIGLIAVIVFYLTTALIWASIYTVDFVNQFQDIPDIHLTEEQRKILLQIEDPTFDTHIGVDLSDGQGLTTISSKLITQVFYNGKQLEGIGGVFQSIYKAVFSCCKRVDFGRDLMAVVLNAKTSKADQLQLYLKTTYMGGYKGVQYTGFNDASLAYYGIPLEKTSKSQFIGLVAMPLSPNQYHPYKYPAKHQARVIRIEKLLSGACVANGWLDLEYQNCGN
jgi:membrane carboxypeptidase/penicillin-binding protein